MASVPSSWGSIPDWQRQVAGSINPILQGYVWQQYSAAPSPVPREAYSYFDLTKHVPAWYTGAAWRYAASVDGSGNFSVSGTLTVTGAVTFNNTLTVTGAATLNTLAVGAITGSGSITTSSGLGFRTGAGGAVTQATSRTTSVTLNRQCGRITLVSDTGSASWQAFTVNCNQVDAADVVIVNQRSGTDKYMIHVTAVANGSFEISFATTGGTTSEQPVFNFAIIKAVNA